jgi:hypothetical protein
MHFNYVRVSILSLLTLPLIFSYSTQAQVADAEAQLTKQHKEDERKRELERKALVLLDQLVAESASFSIAENRITVLLEASQMLWSRDEARARKLLDELKEQVIALHAQPVSGVAQNIRTQILYWLGSKNAELALDFLRSTRAPSTDGMNKGNVQDETQLEVRLASTVAASNPQLAYQMAEELLKTDSQSQVVDIWRNLRLKDPQLGRKLADKMIAELKSNDLLNNGQNFYLALSLLYQIKETAYSPAISRPAVSGDDGKGSSGMSNESIDWERQAYRDLLDLIAGAALKFLSEKSSDATETDRVSGHELLTQINNFMPEIESQLPARAGALRGKVAQFEKILPRSPSVQLSEYERQMQEMQGKSGKELLDMASSVPPELKEGFFINAIAKASEQGDIETARNIANLHGETYPQLKQFLGQIEGQFVVKSAAEGKYDEAKRALSNLGSDEVKVSILVQLAFGALGKKDEKRARGFLEEASAILGDKMRTKNQLSAQVAIAGGYREIDPNRSFELMEAAIDRLNQVSAAAKEYFAFTDDDDAEISLMSGPMVEMFSSLAPELAQLAYKDFDRAAGVLKRAQIPEMRVRLGLNLLLNILNSQSEKPQ